MLARKNSLSKSRTPNGAPAATIKKWVSCLSVLIAFAFAGCSSKGELPPGREKPTRITSTLVAGDVLRISFPGAVEMDQVQRIPPDGKLALPMIGEVRAAGRTLTSLQSELTSRYKTNLQNSSVIVSIQTFANGVYVNGAVARPGKIPLVRSMTVYEAIMEAGGVARPFGDPKNVILTFIENGQHRSFRLDVSPALKGLPIPAIYLKPYDVLYIGGQGSSGGQLSATTNLQ